MLHFQLPALLQVLQFPKDPQLNQRDSTLCYVLLKSVGNCSMVMAEAKTVFASKVYRITLCKENDSTYNNDCDNDHFSSCEKILEIACQLDTQRIHYCNHHCKERGKSCVKQVQGCKNCLLTPSPPPRLLYCFSLLLSVRLMQLFNIAGFGSLNSENCFSYFKISVVPLTRLTAF